MDYKTEVEKEAYDFLLEIEADIKAAIIAEVDDVSEIVCDESGYGEIRDAFFESVTDRAYSIEDAAYVIANCEEQETDTGLWDGQEMHEAMQACAAFSYANDVWAELEEVYERLYDEFVPSWKVIDVLGDDAAGEDGENIREFEDEDAAQDWIDENDKDGDEGYEVTEGRGNIEEVWSEYESDFNAEPVEVGSDDELYTLKQWVRLAEKAGTWGGYPLGSVYIDARCGTGYSMPDVKDFYDFDVIARQKVPGMVGKYGDAVKVRIEELEGITAPPVKLTVDIGGDTIEDVLNRLQHIRERVSEGDTGSHDWKLTERRGGASA